MHLPETDNQTTRETLQTIEASLEQMLLGKASDPISPVSENALLNRIVDLANMLSVNFAEMAGFARSISEGELDITPPGRRNYLAAPLKELHSQLSNFTWIARQLAKGRPVERLDYAGELSDALNSLIDRVAEINAGRALPRDREPAMDSWRYHQVLTAFDHLPHMVLVVGGAREILFANRPALKFFGNSIELYAEDHPRFEMLPPLLKLISSLSGEANTFPCYREASSRNDVWFKISSDLIVLPRGVRAYLHCLEDISEWKRSETDLKRSATTDELTGVYNRGIAIMALEDALVSRQKFSSCVAFIDIDRLKYINDHYGHDEGDYVIKTIAQTVSGLVRETDTVSRFGGDEFVVVFPNCSINDAEMVIRRVYERIQAINETGAKPYKLSFSHGLTPVDQYGNITIKELIQLSDKKMYEHKAAKKVQRSED